LAKTAPNIGPARERLDSDVKTWAWAEGVSAEKSAEFHFVL